MTDDLGLLEQALSEAHLPALAMALVHLTGSATHLTDDMRPMPSLMGEKCTAGLPVEAQARIRDLARDAIAAYIRGGKHLPVPPSQATIVRMLDILVGSSFGGSVPTDYLPYLFEQLGLDGADSNYPRWDDAESANGARMKVVIIGAGMSGILAAIRLKQAGVDFELFEKNAEVGGTWLENSYPGCRVDTESHIYAYSFEPNPPWTQHYSTQPVLLDYFKSIAEKYELRSRIHFNSPVTEAIFDEGRRVWRVRFCRPDGREEVVEATAVISAVGQLNQPKIPEIAGRESFEGTSFHSARWRHDVKLDGQRVAVIGTGASAFQFVPEVAKTARKLLVFQRSFAWMLPTSDYHSKIGAGKRWLLEHLPYYEKWYRFWLFWLSDRGGYALAKVDPTWPRKDSVSEGSYRLRHLLIAALRLQTAGPLLRHVIPDFPVWGKRCLRDNGDWLRTLARDNVTLVTEGIREITRTGIVTNDNVLHEADVLIYGTGFQASRFLSTMRVVGRGGAELHQRWDGDSRAYLGMTLPEFPNFFMLFGPNTYVAVNASEIFISECSVRYILGCLRLLAQTGRSTLEPRAEVHDEFNVMLDEAGRNMAWGVPHVSSWYRNEKGRSAQNWPLPQIDYWKLTLKPNPSDFTFG